MSTALDIREEGLENRTDQAHTGLEIWQYEFFAPDDENQYTLAEAEENAQYEGLRLQPFSGEFPEDQSRGASVERTQSLGILESTPEYTQGLYNEYGAQTMETGLPVILIAAACAAAFFAARLLNSYKRRKAR